MRGSNSNKQFENNNKLLIISKFFFGNYQALIIFLFAHESNPSLAKLYKISKWLMKLNLQCRSFFNLPSHFDYLLSYRKMYVWRKLVWKSARSNHLPKLTNRIISTKILAYTLDMSKRKLVI